MLRSGLIALLYYAVLLACLFVPAGRADWPMGWITMGVYVAISLASLLRADRGLVRERGQMWARSDRTDVALASVSFLFFHPLALLVAGFDAGRYGWSPRFPLAAQVAGLALFALGNAFGCWALVSNRFFSTYLRIQADRGHQVVADGPYRIVRHPGYAGTILACLALPISLGSLWALIPAIGGACGFGVRTAREDAILLHALPGYRDYARQVRYRLVPGVW